MHWPYRNQQQNNQVGQLGGIAKHLLCWLSSKNNDTHYGNPVCLGTQNKKTVTLYYIHGFIDGIGGMAALSEALRNGLPAQIADHRVVAFQCGARNSIEAYTKELSQKILNNHETDIVLMGHSMGGLISALFAEEFAKKLQVRVHAVISICSPFEGGNSVCDLFASVFKPVHQMKKNSPFLRRLAALMRASSIPYLCIGASEDRIVSAQKSAVTNHPGCTALTISGHNHLSVVHSEKTVHEIRSFLNKIDFTAAQLSTPAVDSEEGNSLPLDWGTAPYPDCYTSPDVSQIVQLPPVYCVANRA